MSLEESNKTLRELPLQDSPYDQTNTEWYEELFNELLEDMDEGQDPFLMQMWDKEWARKQEQRRAEMQGE